MGKVKRIRESEEAPTNGMRGKPKRGDSEGVVPDIERERPEAHSALFGVDQEASDGDDGKYEAEPDTEGAGGRNSKRQTDSEAEAGLGQQHRKHFREGAGGPAKPLIPTVAPLGAAANGAEMGEAQARASKLEMQVRHCHNDSWQQ